MATKKESREILIRNNPNLSATKLLVKAKAKGISNRKTEFLKEVRTIRKLPEPSKAKRERSIPLKHKRKRATKSKPTKRKVQTTLKPKAKIPFEKTKFGKITKDLQKKHRISEKSAIRRARKLLKIPKKDFNKLNKKDFDILVQYGY